MRQLMSRIISFVSALGALALGAGTWLGTHSWWKGALVSLGCGLLAFGKKVWSEVEPQWVKRTAGWTDNLVMTILAGYQKCYAKHLYYKHRTFDVKGFSTQGKFALELESVYVDLSVDPVVPGNVSQDPIRLPSKEEQKFQGDV